MYNAETIVQLVILNNFSKFGMDLGKRPRGFVGGSNKLYLDLKDIIREHGLHYLPAKSLFKLRTVCRDWRLHISTPFFAHNQSLCFRIVSGFFYQPSRRSPLFLSTDPTSCDVPDPSLSFLPEAVDIRSSSNGLLCCQGHCGDRSYYICNPVTKQYKKLPKPSADHGPDPSVVLIFEPSLLNFVADYKLVCPFPSVDFDNATEFDIYSSKDDSWGVSAEICFANRALVSNSGVYADGVVYWQAKVHGILAFDLKKERSRLIPAYRSFKSPLGLMNGKLCVAFATNNKVSLNVLSNVYRNTMEMTDKTREWEEKTQFQLDSTLFGEFGGDVSMLFIGGDMVLAQAGKTIVSYDLKTRESKVISSNGEFSARVFPYVNSLVCI